ncbi:MAG: type II secretion system F family protein [Candidatus Riflebacteria bacterium]|nr:type II secretion system F family protein [Candidatus Riflebacteria bacterium]
MNKTESAKCSDLIIFAETLRLAHESKVGLNRFLEEISGSITGTNVESWIRTISEKLQQGCSFKEAATGISGMDPVLSGLLGSENEMVLSKNLAAYSRNLIKLAEFHEKIKNALFYPFIILLFSFGALLIVNFIFWPSFASSLKGNPAIPTITKIVFFVDMVNFPLSAVFLVAVISLLAGAGWFLFFSSASVIQNSFITDFFFFKSFFQNELKARITGDIGIFLESGMSLPDALTFSTNYSASGSFSSELTNAAENLKSGMEPAESFRNATFLNSFQEILNKKTSEISPEVFYSLRDLYFKQAILNSDRLTQLAFPVMMVICGIMTMLLCLGIYGNCAILAGNYQ